LRTTDRGEVSVLGLNPTRDVYALQERIGVQLQEAQLQKRIKVWEAVAFWASFRRAFAPVCMVPDESQREGCAGFRT
jgi:ABC-2 type transport system ATP-binding protein